MKTWILEKWQSPADMQETLQQMVDLIKFAKTRDDVTDESISEFQRGLDRHLQRMADNPDGYWLGFEGKCKYRDFCYRAKETMRRNRDATFRVVQADVEDGAWTWMGYKNPVPNDKVLRYLYATL